MGIKRSGELSVNVKRHQSKSIGLLTPPMTPLQEKSCRSVSGTQVTKNLLVSLVSDKENIADSTELRLIKEAQEYDAENEIEAPETNAYRDSVYTQAKKLFCKSLDVRGGDLVGREAEAAEVTEFLTSRIALGESDFLYISGPPGSGKTQQINNIINGFARQQNACKCRIAGKSVSVLRVNCMRMTNVKDIFEEFLQRFGISVSNYSSYSRYCDRVMSDSKDLFVQVLNHVEFAQGNVIVLDELDGVLSKDKSHGILDLFSLVGSCNLLVIGIANALNLVNKITCKVRIKPQTVKFLPYTAQNIEKIVTQKLALLNRDSEYPIINPAALKLCAKKAAGTGDLRKAFDIIYKLIELVETSTKKHYLSNPEKSLADYYKLDCCNAPKVLLSHIAKTCAGSLNGVSSSNRMKQMNIFQCLTLICLAKYEQKTYEETIMKNALKEIKNGLRKHASGTNITQLYQYYKLITKKDDQVPSGISKAEFGEILTNLHTIGLINVMNKANQMSINSQSVLSVCGVGLGDLKEFVTGKYDILRRVF